MFSPCPGEAAGIVATDHMQRGGVRMAPCTKMANKEKKSSNKDAVSVLDPDPLWPDPDS